MVATPLTLPIRWEKYPLLLCTATETVADLANEFLRSYQPRKIHNIDDRAESVAPPQAPLLAAEHTKSIRDPYLRPPKAKLLAYVDVFVENFLGLAQGPRHRCRHVRCMLLHALDKVFWPLDLQDTKHRKEVLLLKKLEAGDCS